MVAFLLLCAAVLAGCGSSDAPAEKSESEVVDGGTLRLAVAAFPDSLNVHRAGPLSGAEDFMAPTRGSAVRVLDDGTWEVDPTYAEAVEVVGTEPLTVSVRLNPAGVWSDGSPIDAADMQAFAAAQAGSGGQLATEAARWRVVAGVEPGADPYSYTVTFAEPTADWPAFIYPGLPAEATPAELYNGFVDAAPPANGPFVLAGLDRAAGTARFEPNPHWWGQAPHLEAITVRLASSVSATELYADGALDTVVADSGTIGALLESGVGRLERSAGTEWSQITLNAGRGPLANPQVRAAVAKAIDREAYAGDVAAALGGEPTLVGSVSLVPGQAGYTDSWGEVVAHDPKAAAADLAAAGWTLDGRGALVDQAGTPLTLRLPVPAGSPMSRARADRIADDLAEIGIGVQIEEVPAETFFSDTVVALDFDLVTYLWTSRPFGLGQVVDRFFPIDARANFTGQGEQSVGEALTGARLNLDDATRPAALAAADRAVFSTAAVVPLALEPSVWAVADDVVGLSPRQFGEIDWTAVGFTQ